MSFENIAKLRQERAGVLVQMRELADSAEKREDKRYTEQESLRWSGLVSQSEQLGAQIERQEQMQTSEMRVSSPVKSSRPEESAEMRTLRYGTFLKAIADLGAGRQVSPEVRAATGLSEGVPSDGGYLVGTDMSTELFRAAIAESSMASMCNRIPISGNSNGIKINAIDETSRVRGSRGGGVQAYWLAEAATKVGSRPKLRQMELTLKKLAAICYATDELIQDAASLGTVIQQEFPREMSWEIDDAILRGSGAGKPLGILNSPALVTVAKEGNQPADTIVAENIVKMYSRMIASSRSNAVWFINQDIEPQLFTMALSVGVGGVPVYMPANGLADAPYGRLFGRPVMPIEQAAALGDLGDIVFADMSQYTMIDKGGIQQAESMHVQFLFDETVYRFVTRVDGQPRWSAPLTPASGSTNTLSPFVALAARA